eukprot:TRINITY_DN1137_c9_g1_i1.p1 TRINITY_DN1137_c9_g1~~TRINITY_DN1137_c9_g1_i1.p1  ORF type:complete len:274 (+),score=41.59 TRINITY_DN1137_c9_g1_i1:50-871(+)
MPLASSRGQQAQGKNGSLEGKEKTVKKVPRVAGLVPPKTPRGVGQTPRVGTPRTPRVAAPVKKPAATPIRVRSKTTMDAPAVAPSRMRSKTLLETPALKQKVTRRSSVPTTRRRKKTIKKSDGDRPQLSATQPVLSLLEPEEEKPNKKDDNEEYHPYSKTQWEYENLPGEWETIVNSFEMEFYYMGEKGRCSNTSAPTVRIDTVEFEVDFSSFTMRPSDNPSFRPVSIRRVLPEEEEPKLEAVSSFCSVLTDGPGSNMARGFSYLKKFSFGEA